MRTELRTAASRRPARCRERRAACRISGDPQFHTKSGVARSRRLQQTPAMFFDDPAAGAQRKGGRLVLAFGVERRRVRQGLRSPFVRSAESPDERSPDKPSPEAASQAEKSTSTRLPWLCECTISVECVSRLRWALICPARCMQTWRIWFESASTGGSEAASSSRTELPSASSCGASNSAVVCSTELMFDSGKSRRSLTRKREQARHQRGGAANLLADLRGLRLFLRRQGRHIQQVASIPAWR